MLFNVFMVNVKEANTPEEAARLFSEEIIKGVMSGSLNIQVITAGDLQCADYPQQINIKLNHNEVDQCFNQAKK